MTLPTQYKTRCCPESCIVAKRLIRKLPVGVNCCCRHAWCKRNVDKVCTLTALASWHHSLSRYKRFHPPYWATCETRQSPLVNEVVGRGIK